MPQYLSTKKGGIHRTACFALYRALLRQGTRIPHVEQQTSLRAIIRARFRKNVALQSPEGIKTAIEFGYTTLQALRDLQSISQWSAHLSDNVESYPHRKAYNHFVNHFVSPTSTAPTRSIRWNLPTPKRIVSARPDALPMLSRPYPSISGPRHIPKLAHATGIPFLRFKKPQSPYLSRIITDKIKKRERRLVLFNDMMDKAVMADKEDDWDNILCTTCGLCSAQEEGLWATPFLDVAREVTAKKKQEEEKAIELARKMYEIVEQEKALAEQEGMGSEADERIDHDGR